MEPMDIVGKSKEDASLPKATMTKIIKEMLPPDVRVARDAQDLLIECCVEFINLVSSESNEVCGREEKRTIAPEHVLKALQVHHQFDSFLAYFCVLSSPILLFLFLMHGKITISLSFDVILVSLMHMHMLKSVLCTCTCSFHRCRLLKVRSCAHDFVAIAFCLVPFHLF
ncbi:uncharacterized protein LOC131145989 isoform X1 [Malania oleifera]|uniref:uncharacterized protein LOC131145989 isoform X1 n=1 Tax=Malania oleifera TaxID=397392 RepID=UPI0025AE4AF7|nr:uncharacterized protein LOC131145989 isoform X1 [Malania oleifera]